MRITQEGDYAMRVVLYLCRCGQDHRVEAKVISANENVPPRFLLKLLRKLAVAGIVTSHMGYKGGYAVEKSPADITVKDVIEAIEGPIYVNKCLEDKSLCNVGRADSCVIHKALAKAQDNLTTDLGSITFSKLLSDENL